MLKFPLLINIDTNIKKNYIFYLVPFIHNVKNLAFWQFWGKYNDGILLFHCNDCKVRNCAMPKDIKTCAECPDYSCEKLETLWNEIQTSEGKTNLDKIRNSL